MYLRTYSMEQSSSWNANRLSGSQEIPRILQNPVRKADSLPPYRAVVMKSGSLNFLEPSGPAQACYERTFFTEPEGSLPQSQVLATYPYPEPAQSSPYPHILHPEDLS